jgi:hypothetical protein
MTRGPVSPALFVAMIALVAALAGSAVALPGKNTVDKNDIKKGAVTKKALKKGAVTKKALKKGAVTNPALATAAVTPTKIAPHEAPQLVGTANGPAFGNGGDGDCVWENVPPGMGISGVAPVGFFKDQVGVVHLQGIAVSTDGPGGDGVCDPTDPGEIADGVVFTLPSGYAPTSLQFRAGEIFAVPAAGAVIDGDPLPASSVFTGSTAILDGFTFEASPG